MIVSNFNLTKSKAVLNVRTSSTWNIENLIFHIEYTKYNDDINTPIISFESYLHFISSDSVNNEVKTINLENIGVRFKQNCDF